MKKFESFLKEERMTTHAEIILAIAHHKKAGEIMNPVYINLVDQAKRVMRGGKYNPQPDSVLDTLAKHREDKELSDLYYTSFDGFTSHGKIAKLIDKLEKKNIPAYKKMIADVKEYLKDWKSVGEDLKLLKTKVVKTIQKRAEAKAEATKVMDKKKVDSAPLIKIFESHMNEYITVAGQRAKEFIQQKLEVLKNNDWDLNKVAPSPNTHYGSAVYQQAKAKRDLYTSLTKSKTGYMGRNQPDIRVPNPEMIDRYIKLAKQGAEDSYRGFMEKMIQKIGKPVIDAKMTGNIWTNALLTVTTDDGEQQVWDTKMILNFSKYQKMFNQFPSRRKS